MACTVGPKIIDDGLVFYYDMYNTERSWRGKPTTNLVPDPNANNLARSGTVTTATISLPLEVAINSNSVDVPFIFSGSWIAQTSATTSSGQQYMCSWYIKSYTATSVHVSWGGAHTGSQSTATISLIDGSVTSSNIISGETYKIIYIENGWWRIGFTTTLTGSSCYPQLNPNGGLGIYICGSQIELGNILTPFVSGTRSNTQAILDLTGNNIITASSLTYNSDGTFSFNGVDTYANASSLFLPTNITVSIWAKKTGTVNTYSPLVEQGGSRPFRFILYNEQLAFGNDGTVDTFYRTALGFSTLNTWYNYVATFDGTYHVYVNGVEQSVIQTPGAYGPWGTNQLNFGYRLYTGAVSAFNGFISQTQIYNRALSASEIAQNFEATRSRFNI